VNLHVSSKTICGIRPIERQEAGYARNTACGLLGSNAFSCGLWTGANKILFVKRNPNRVADSYFLPRCGSLVDNQSGLKG
jgi:hypothetical protein